MSTDITNYNLGQLSQNSSLSQSTTQTSQSSTADQIAALQASLDSLPGLSDAEKKSLAGQVTQLNQTLVKANDADTSAGKSARIDTSKMSIDTLLAMVMLDRYNALQDLTKKQVDTVKELNNQLRAWGTLKAALAVYGNDVSKPDDPVELNKTPGSDYASLQKIIDDNKLGINLSDYGVKKNDEGKWTTTKGNLSKLMQQIDTETTSATNIQNEQYTTLQDYSQKLTQALDLASNISKKFFDTRSGIVGNMR